MLARSFENTPQRVDKKQLHEIYVYSVTSNRYSSYNICVINQSSNADGACGYGALAFELSNGYAAGVVPSLFKQGAGCGSCFQVNIL